jgi:hypothetical protein
LSTLLVYRSNLDLLQRTAVLYDAGYLVVPARQVTPPLGAIEAALCGGVFFTLTTGAALILTAAAAAVIWKGVLRRSRIVLTVLVLLWCGGVAAGVAMAVGLVETLMLAVVPATAFWFTARWYRIAAPVANRWLWGAMVLPFLLLTVLWSTQFSDTLFIDIRDHLLLRYQAGRAVNDFYYRYTLYAAEAFKSLQQKTLKTCRLTTPVDSRHRDALIKALAARDYLFVEPAATADLELRVSGGIVEFVVDGGPVVRTDMDQFITDPDAVLQTLSARCDRHRVFRRFTFASLLVAFPALLYVSVFSICVWLLSALAPPKTACLLAAAICLMVGTGLLVPVRDAPRPPADPAGVRRWMRSPQWADRVAAFRAVERQGLDIGAIEGYRSALVSPWIPERYWLARTLAVSRLPATMADLMQLVEDPHPNVVCMALRGVGRRGGDEAEKVLIGKVQTSNHWYVQWYAYRALRQRGWTQSVSH